MSKVMDGLSQEYYGKGKEEEKMDNTIQFISALMESFNLTVSQAMDVLKIPASERETYLERIR